MNQDKVTFFSTRTSLTFTHYPPSPSGTCALPFDFMLGRRDSQIIFNYHCDVRIIRTRSSIVYYLMNMNILTNCCGLYFLSVYLCSRFLSFLSSTFHWQYLYLFSENIFLEELASYWFLTFNVTSFFFLMKIAALIGIALRTYL